MDAADAESFADSWERAWNSRDLDALLGHFEDDVLWTSPVAARAIPGSGGVVRGKEALRAYYAMAGKDLHFDVVGVYAGVDIVVINYRNQRGSLVNEVLLFGSSGLVREGHGTYQGTEATTAIG
ncbi:MAG TPA: nuclear transport factor 2 family protein [Acidimicrobiales bacterium]|nr:nuclear transport factor 2 family protein [Acidimicrobiales bacterium]